MQNVKDGYLEIVPKLLNIGTSKNIKVARINILLYPSQVLSILPLSILPNKNFLAMFSQQCES